MTRSIVAIVLITSISAYIFWTDYLTFAATPSAATTNSSTKEGPGGEVPIAIDLSTRTWSLRVYQDGSGNYGYGSSGGDFAQFEKGTFNAALVVDKIEKIGVKNESDIHLASVWIPRPPNTPINGFFSDRETIEELFEKAAQACRSDKLVKLAKKYPFIKTER